MRRYYSYIEKARAQRFVKNRSRNFNGTFNKVYMLYILVSLREKQKDVCAFAEGINYVTTDVKGNLRYCGRMRDIKKSNTHYDYLV